MSYYQTWKWALLLLRKKLSLEHLNIGKFKKCHCGFDLSDLCFSINKNTSLGLAVFKYKYHLIFIYKM